MDTVQLDLFGNPILPQPPAKKAKAAPATNPLPTPPNEPLVTPNPVDNTPDEILPASTELEVLEVLQEEVAPTIPELVHHSEDATIQVTDLPSETNVAFTEPASTIVYSNDTIAVKIKTAATTIVPDSNSTSEILNPEIATTAATTPLAAAQDDAIPTVSEDYDAVTTENTTDITEIIDVPLNENSATITHNTVGKRGRKSFKEMDAAADLIEVPPIEILEKKLYYSISEVAGWFKVNNSQIRFWENEFDILQPRKTRKGDRLFRVEDIKNLQLIHHLLRNKKYSIEGAKEYLKANKAVADKEMMLIQSLNHFRSFLLELKTNLQAS